MSVVSADAAKARPNHQVYLRALRALTPGQRLRTALELTDLSRVLFRDGLRTRFPSMDEADLDRVYLERLEKCHNRRS